MKVEKREQILIQGLPRLTARDKKTGKILKQIQAKNLTMNVGKNLVAAIMADESGYDTGLTYCAIGTDDTAVAAGQIKLVAEAARKIITSKTRADNVVTYSTYFPADECAYSILEVAIFGHSTASASADSGVMFARALLTYDNSLGLADLTIDWPCQYG